MFFMARVADQSERYEYMFGFLKEIVQESSREALIDDCIFLKIGFINFIHSWDLLGRLRCAKKHMLFLSSLFAFSLLEEEIPYKYWV